MVRSASLTSLRTVPKSFEVAEMKTLTGASAWFASLLRVAMGEDQLQFYISQSLCGSFFSVNRSGCSARSARQMMDCVVAARLAI